MKLQKLCFSSSNLSNINIITKQLTIQNQIKLGIKPTISSLNHLLALLSLSNRFNLSLHFYSQIISNSIKPNKKSNSIFAEGILKLYNGSKSVEHVVLNMKNFGVKMENGIFDSVVCKACVLEKDTDLAFNLMQEFMKNDGFVPSYYTLYTLIKSLGYNGDIESALKVFDVMSERNEKYPYWNYVSSLLITRFSKIGKLEFGMRVYERMKKIDGFSPNLVTYTSLIHALCKNGRTKEALNLAYEMENKGMKPDIGTYNTLINGLCKVGKIQEANEISHGIIADNYTYSILLHSFMKEKDEFSIMEIKNRIEDSGIIMDINTCNALIEALFIIGKINDAHNLFVEMPKRGLFANYATYGIIINGYKEIGEFDELLEVFDDHIENYVFEEKRADKEFNIFEELIKGYLLSDSNEILELNSAQFRENLGEKVLILVREIERSENGLVFSLISNHAIVLIQNYPNYALEIYCLLQKKGLRITSNTSYILIKSLFENRSEKYIIQALICEYIKLYPNFEPKIIKLISQYPELFNDIKETIIKLTNEGRIKEAYNIIQTNIQNGVSIDISSYCLLIYKLCKAGYIEKALDLCENMKNTGVYPNIIIYNSVLNGLCKEGCLIEAFRLVKFLEENEFNLKPTIYTYAPLVSTLCKEGLLEDALEVFDKMLQRNISPNIFVINLIINGYCLLGLINDSLMFLRNMQEKYFVQPDGLTLSSILRGYYYNGDIENAYKYYIEYKIKNIFPDYFGFMHLINGFYSKGRMEETRGVIREMLSRTEIDAIVNKYGNGLYNESLVSLLLNASDQGKIKEVMSILKEIGAMYNYNLKDLYKIDFGVKNGEVFKGKFLYGDFEECYLIMKELCSKGEVKEVDNLINDMIINSEVK